MTCKMTREQNDELCAAIIKSGIEITDKYMKEHSTDRTASSSSRMGFRNEVYALRQLMLGRPILTERTLSTIESNKAYELPIDA